MDLVIGFLEWLALFAVLQTVVDRMIIMVSFILFTPLFLKWWPLVAKSPDRKLVYIAIGYWAGMFGWMISYPQTIIQLF